MSELKSRPEVVRGNKGPKEGRPDQSQETFTETEDDEDDEMKPCKWDDVKSRFWVFTGRHEDRKVMHDKLSVKYTYGVYQQERSPKGGRLHWQGYVYHKNAVKGSVLRKIVRGWIDIARGEPHQAAAYCMKEDTRVDGPWEWGERPKGQGARSDIKKVVDLVKDGASMEDIYKMHGEKIATMKKGIDSLKSCQSKEISENRKGCEIIWCNGMDEAYETATLLGEPFYIAPGNISRPGGDWQGYDNERIILVDKEMWKGDLTYLSKPWCPPIKNGFMPMWPCWEIIIVGLKWIDPNPGENPEMGEGRVARYRPDLSIINK